MTIVHRPSGTYRHSAAEGLILQLDSADKSGRGLVVEINLEKFRLLPQAGVVGTGAAEQPKPPLTTPEAVQALNESRLFGVDRELTFVRDPLSRREIMKIVDKGSGKILLQLPGAYAVQLAELVRSQG